MGEIKFRIWDKQFNKFVYQLPEKHHFDWERFDVQQFTGLKDKNGKEIYEGDIIPYQSLEQKGFHIVMFDDGCFMLGNGESACCHIKDNCEVIGNIYENPDLIN